MALSNWDTMAVNAKGEPTNGVFTSKLGVTVEIYKNWLYLRDEKAWQEGGRFVKSTVGQIESGVLTYKDVSIVAKRGPQGGVYCVVKSERYDYVGRNGCKICKRPARQEKPDWQGKRQRNFHESGCPVVFDAMIGIGCYAYKGQRFVGVQKKSLAFLRRWLNESRVERMNLSGTTYWTDDKGRKRVTRNKPRWKKYRSYSFDEHVRAIPLTKTLRFNQGDAFFARNLKFKVPATKPGKGGETILMRSIRAGAKGPVKAKKAA
jgi:hypothetical protein